jgi:hypothetical protein
VQGHATNSATVSLDATSILNTGVEGLILLTEEGVGPGILGERSHFSSLANSGVVNAINLAVLLTDLSSSVSSADLLLHLHFVGFDFILDFHALAAKFIFFKFDKGFLLNNSEVFFLHFIDFLSEFFMLVFNHLDVASNHNLFTIDAVLVMLVEVTFLAEFLPRGFCVISNNFSLTKFHLHSFNLGF